MVYAPQRRHAVASFATTIHTLGVLQHLYSPNILILLSRVLAQVQIAVTSSMHPTRSLMSLFFMVTFMNAVAMFLHFLDFVSGMNGGKGIILDFIGQSRPASLFRMIVLDILIYYLQVSSLTVSYITMRSAPLPETPSLPFKDVLLPPSSSIPYEYIESDEKDLDLESGQSVRKRSKGKGKASDGDDVNEFWLDDEDDEDRGASTTSRLLANSSIPLSSRSTRQEPPLIFSLSLSHILNLVFYLPAPPPPPRVFSGGTPSVSPRINPMNELPPTTPPTATRPPAVPTPATPGARADSAAEDADETETSPQTGRRGRGAVGLMPGDYWVAGRDRGESG